MAIPSGSGNIECAGSPSPVAIPTDDRYAGYKEFKKGDDNVDPEIQHETLDLAAEYNPLFSLLYTLSMGGAI